MKYATALAEWLEPYHNHARPPAAVLLAEAAKQTEPRPRGTEPSSKNGNGMHVNGGSKKEDEPPAVKEPPEIVSRFFDGQSGSLIVWFSCLKTRQHRYEGKIQGSQGQAFSHGSPSCGDSYAGGQPRFKLQRAQY